MKKYGQWYTTLVKKLQIDLSRLKQLGIDEIAMRKGQGDYIVVLVDLDRRVPLGFAPSRQQENIRQVLEGWGEPGLSQIVEVSIDLSRNYKGIVHKLLPNAGVIADRFHVTGYFENRTTSGVIEGINNKLKLIKRSGYGFRNFDNFQLRCLICWHLAITLA